jgi:paraquat-inducible protein B
MSKPVNKTIIGLFVVGAIALTVVAVLFLGSGKFFTDRPKYVTYFQGSVKGLSVGSPVVFRGVKVGHVKEIRMRFDPKSLEMQIPVYIELGEGNLEIVGTKKTHSREIIKKKERDLIDHGFRAQLATQSFVTGQLMIALDFFPGTPVNLVGAEPRYTEIPSIPTPMQELQNRLETLPIEETFNKLQNVADGIDKLVNSPEIKQILKSTEQGINSATSLLNDVAGQITPLATDIREALDEITKMGTETRNDIRLLAESLAKTSDEAGLALKKIEGSFTNIENLTGEGSNLTYIFKNTLKELELTARSLRILTENIDQQPQSVVFGKKKMGKE